MYYTYIIRCRDNSLYTGYTIDIKRRLREHTKGINSKYTRSRGFSKLEIYFVCESKSDAMKLEYKIKQKSRYQKLNIIENPEDFIQKLKNLTKKLIKKILLKNNAINTNLNIRYN